MYITTQGIRFDIVTTNSEITYLDENNETLTWDNTISNAELVNVMVHELTTKEL